MKRLVSTFNILVLAALPSSVVLAEEWLFIHTAKEAQVINNTTLVMPVTRDIFAFIERLKGRPYRKHTYMSGEKFSSMWSDSGGDSFKADPPNAILTWVDGKTINEAKVVIKDASFDGKSMTYTHSYVATKLNGKTVPICLFIDSTATKRMVMSKYPQYINYRAISGWEDGARVISKPSDVCQSSN
jgi:hypothetical protein